MGKWKEDDKEVKGERKSLKLFLLKRYFLCS